MKISTENIQKKSAYIAPQLTEVEFRVERGFAESGSEENPYAGMAANLQQQVQLEFDLNGWLGEASQTGGQVVSGRNATGNSNDGLAAGYFTYEDGNSWF